MPDDAVKCKHCGWRDMHLSNLKGRFTVTIIMTAAAGIIALITYIMSFFE